MTDEAPAVEQDQPEAPDAPETEQPSGAQEESFTESFNPEDLPEEARGAYEQAYKQMQGDYTRKTQEIAQERQEAQEYREFLTAIQNDPAARDAWLQQEFGYEFEDGEPEFLDPEEELRAEVEALKGHLTQQQEEQFASQAENETIELIDAGIDALENSQGNGFKFSDEETSFLTTWATAHPTPNGAPDVQGAGQALQQIVDKRQEQWIASKKSGRRISQGAPARKAIDPTNQEERFKLYDEIAEEAAPSME